MRPSPAVLVFALLVCCTAPARARAMDDVPWLLIDTGARTVFVRSGERELDRFEAIAVGRGGVVDVHYANDHTTPRGRYRVTRINPRSKFRIFIGVDYPTLEHARRAYLDGRLRGESLDRIEAAVRRGVPPPEDTELGGAIGIHGIGAGSMRVHATLNWTQGCIALTNAQIERLARYVWIGMRVEIR
jgi:murein L,D-transpeptidase YafK